MMRVPKRTCFLQFLTRRDAIFFLGRGQGPMALLPTPRNGCWTAGHLQMLSRSGFREGPVNLGFIHHHRESQDAETVARPGDIKCEGLSFQGRRR